MMSYTDLKERMKGVIAVLVTPFKNDGSLDLEGLKSNVSWLMNQMEGKDFSLMVEGSNGEFFNQSEEEWKSVIKTVVEEVGSDNPILAHTGQCGTRETIKRSKYAQSVGADGVVAVLPYYITPQEEGMYQHYKQLCESIDIGVILYNNPFVSGSWVRPPVMAELAKIPNFVAIKENTSSLISFKLMQDAVEPNAVVLCGRGEEIYQFVAPLGCPGFVSFIANIAPKKSYDIYQAAMEEDFNKVEKLANEFSLFFKDSEVVRTLDKGESFTAKVTSNHGKTTSVSGGGSPMQFAELKAGMDMMGLNGGKPRLPLTELTEEEKKELKERLKEINIL